ncbi:unnamed protein product [Sphacelaria rigidula]
MSHAGDPKLASSRTSTGNYTEGDSSVGGPHAGKVTKQSGRGRSDETSGPVYSGSRGIPASGKEAVSNLSSKGIDTKQRDSDSMVAAVGHYGPGARGMFTSTDDIGRADMMRANQRHQMVIERRAKRGGRALDHNLTPVARIIKEYAGTGPYSLLHRLHAEKRRACVMIRRVNSVRGVCTGLIRGFDKHMNILLADVREDYTTSVPAHPPKSQQKSSPSPPGRASNPPLRDRHHTPGAVGSNAGADIGKKSEPSRFLAQDAHDLKSAPGLHVPVRDGSRLLEDGCATAGCGIAVMREEHESEVGLAKLTEEGHPRRGREVVRGDGKDGRRGEEGVGMGSDIGACSGDVDGKRGTADDKDCATTARKPSSGVVSIEGITTDGSGREQLQSGGGEGRTGAEGRTGDGGGSRDCGGGDSLRTVEMERKSPPQRRAKSGGRRSRHKGRWRGELVEVRRTRYLKQLLIRGDNVVMVWQAPRA